MDLKIIEAKVKEIVAKASSDEGFLEKLKKDPEKAVEGVLGIDLPGEQIKAIAEGAMAKLKLDGLKDKLGGIGDLFKK